MEKIEIKDLDLNLSLAINKGCLLTSGSIDEFNTMTIGWGNIGYLWRKNVFICYVRPSRYTYQFMEKNEFFTVSFYGDEYKQALGYLGRVSGRECDKVKNVNFHPLKIDGSVSFCESYLTIVCKKCYHLDVQEDFLPEEVKKVYYRQKDLHRIYFGEIMSIFKN